MTGSNPKPGDTKKLLEEICKNVEKMTPSHHIEILRIIHQHCDATHINENKNGVYINLSNLFLTVPKVVSEIEAYIKYILLQEQTLAAREQEKIRYMNLVAGTETAGTETTDGSTP